MTMENRDAGRNSFQVKRSSNIDFLREILTAGRFGLVGTFRPHPVQQRSW